MELINVFGGFGFVGGRYCEMTPNVTVNDRNDYNIKTNNVLYFISTVDNYNVWTDPHIDIETNLTTLINVLESSHSEKLTFNFISSWFVYGDVPLPAKEDGPTDPKGFYSITKRAAEQLLASYAETYGFNYRILRLANVIGPQDKKVSAKKNAVQYMINRLKNNEDIQLYDGGKCYRDYIYVDDCVDAINLVLEKGELNTIYNIGNGYCQHLDHIMNVTKERLGSTSNITSCEPKEFHKTVQAKNMVLDVDRLYALGYTPKYTMSDMIDILIK